MPARNRAFTILVGIIATVLIGWVLHVGAGILQPLVIALFLASMLQPVVRQLARFHIPPALTVLTLVVLLAFGLFRLGVLLQDNVRAFVGQVQQPQVEEPNPIEGDQLDPIRESIPGAGEPTVESGWDDIVEQLEVRLTDTELPRPFVRSLMTSLREIDIAALATEVIGSSFGFAKGLFMVLLYMVFIFAEQAVFRRKILSVAGPRHADAASVLDTIGRGIQRYLGVKTLASVLTGALCYLMLVWQGIGYALLFGIVTFLLNYIPTFGSIIAGILPTASALADGRWGTALVIVVTYLAVNLSIGSFLEPKVLGRELNLSPLVIIISVVVWAGLWGVVGTFLAVPITATLQIVLASWDTTRPIAVLLSSGPPRDGPELRARRAGRRRRRKAG